MAEKLILVLLYTPWHIEATIYHGLTVSTAGTSFKGTANPATLGLLA